MPLRRRRRLVRAAAVGGTAYAVGRHSGRKAEAQDAGAQDAGAQEYEPAPQAAQVPQQAAAPPQAPPTSEADRVGALKDLKDLLDSGAISQVEFENEKNRLLSSGR